MKIGIDINDCEKVNNGINDLLDEADLIKEQYFLEVSSPGVERVLKKDKHFEENLGKKVEISLFKSIDNIKNVDGILNKFDNNYIYIEKNDELISIDRKNIALAKLKFDW